MTVYLQTLLAAMRPAFSREATFVWFVVVFAGFVVRHDTYGSDLYALVDWTASGFCG